MVEFKLGHALLVGVGGDLPNTVEDAQGLAAILRDSERCGYPREQVHLLTGSHATRLAILDALDHLAHDTDETSTVVIYFSGHGYQATSTLGHAYFLMPHGYDVNRLYQTALSGREFAEKLQALPAQKLLVLLDCCHAGGVGDAKAPGVAFAKSPLPPEAAALLAEGRGTVLIASSQEDELSYAGRPYSAFTLSLIESLSGQGVAKQDGYVRVTDMALHAREVVPRRTGQRQHPILNFEHADNFAVAYYAGGDVVPKGLPFSVEPEIEPEPGAWTLPMVVNTGGGAYIGGDVTIRGGGFVGRDQVTITGDGNVVGDHSRATVIKRTGGRDLIARAFQRLYALLAARSDIFLEDKADLRAELKDLEAEIGKGSRAREIALKRHFRNIGRISPDFLNLVLAAFLDPRTDVPNLIREVAGRMRE